MRRAPSHFLLTYLCYENVFRLKFDGWLFEVQKSQELRLYGHCWRLLLERICWILPTILDTQTIVGLSGRQLVSSMLLSLDALMNNDFVCCWNERIRPRPIVFGFAVSMEMKWQVATPGQVRGACLISETEQGGRGKRDLYCWMAGLSFSSSSTLFFWICSFNVTTSVFPRREILEIPHFSNYGCLIFRFVVNKAFPISEMKISLSSGEKDPRRIPAIYRVNISSFFGVLQVGQSSSPTWQAE